MTDRLLLLLERLGYGPDRVRPNFRVGAPDGVVVTDAVGFARPYGPFDSSTATLVAQWTEGNQPPNETEVGSGLRAAWALGAPVVVMAAESSLALYAVSESGSGSLLDRYDWDSDLAYLRNALDPRALLDAKLGHRQLGLFPAAARLFATSRARQEQALAPLLTNALSAAEEVLLSEHVELSASEAHARAARIVVGALAASVLRDKESVPERSFAPGGAALDVALQRHPAQFSWVNGLLPNEHELLDGLLELLGDTEYSGVDPSLLSGLYETQLVDSARRRDLGMHYTPMGLARRLVAWMPFEEVAPDSREVYDPTCGSGTLLLAAHDRLRDLQPPDWPLIQSHDDLRRRLHGADRDPVAVGIASLSLLLHASPAGNGWDVSERDSVIEPGPAGVPIIVANPPWSYRNDDGQDDLAQLLLSRMLESLPAAGLLGVVLPDGWLSRASRGARNSRALVTERCDVLEVWRLPSGTFPGARMGAAVVLGRAKSARSQSRPPVTVVRRVNAERELQPFYDRGDAFAHVVSSDPDSWARGPLRSWWDSSRSTTSPTIGTYVRIRSGPQPESRAVRVARRETEAPDEAETRGRLTRFVVWADVDQFADAANYPSEELRFPGDMQNGSRRGQEMIGTPKVLVSGSRDPRQAWRVKVATDIDGVVAVKNTVKALMPRLDRSSLWSGADALSLDDLIYGLVAFLGSGFSSAWLDESNVTREIRAEELTAIPAPPPAVMRRLADIGRALGESVREDAPIDELLDRLEAEVWKWSEVPPDIVSTVIVRLNQSPAPEGGYRYPRVEMQPQSPDGPGIVRPRSGVVVGVDGQTITLSIPGLTPEAGSLVGFPGRMPGALLEIGQPFVVLDDGSEVSRLSFHFHETAWLSDAQVEQELLSAVGVISDVLDLNSE